MSVKVASSESWERAERENDARILGQMRVNAREQNVAHLELSQILQPVAF